jgi:hypothetical protein
MASLSSILTKYNFKQLRPGENDETFQFTGPGICILATETERNGSTVYQPIAAYSAGDALEIAKRALRGHSEAGPPAYRLAFLATVSAKRGERLAVLEQISTHCTTNNDEDK